MLKERNNFLKFYLYEIFLIYKKAILASTNLVYSLPQRKVKMVITDLFLSYMNSLRVISYVNSCLFLISGPGCHKSVLESRTHFLARPCNTFDYQHLFLSCANIHYSEVYAYIYTTDTQRWTHTHTHLLMSLSFLERIIRIKSSPSLSHNIITNFSMSILKNISH